YPPAFRQGDVEQLRLTATFHRHLDLLRGSGRFVVLVLQIAKGPDGRSSDRGNPFAALHAGGLNPTRRRFDDQSLWTIQLDSDVTDVRPAVQVSRLVECACLLPMNQIEVADEVALDALAAGKRALDQRRNLLWKTWRWLFRPPQLSLFPGLM